MTYVALWLWFVGAYMMWEEVRDKTDTRPDPRGAFFDPKAQAWHDANPQLHSTIYLLVQVLTIVAWPVTMTLGILHVVKLKIRPR